MEVIKFSSGSLNVLFYSRSYNLYKLDRNRVCFHVNTLYIYEVKYVYKIIIKNTKLFYQSTKIIIRWRNIFS